MCARRCDAAHEGTRTSHFCSEHGSPLKRNLDALEAAATDGSTLLAGVEELDDLDIDEEFHALVHSDMQDLDSAGAVLDSDV